MAFTIKLAVPLIFTIFLTSCGSAPVGGTISPTEQTTSVPPAVLTSAEPDLINNSNGADPSAPIFKTDMGDFVVVYARLVNEVRGTVAPEGNQFLLVGLAQPDQKKLIAGQFSFEDFQAMTAALTGQIYVLDGGGEKSEYGSMGGWLDMEESVADDFTIGFLVKPSDSYTLYWADNLPIQLSLEPAPAR